MNEKVLKLSEDQYKNLVVALAIRTPQYKSLARFVESLVVTLPDGLVQDVEKIVSGEITERTKADDLYDILMVMDSQKRRTANLEEHFEEIAKANPNLYADTLDVIFSKKKKTPRKLGKLVRSRLALSAARAKINHRAALNNYVSIYLATRSVDSEEVIRAYFDNFPEYKRDITLLSRLATSVNRGANLIAVRYADDSLLPYLVNVKGGQARKELENRINSLTQKTV